jgi:hypothetical protein
MSIIRHAVAAARLRTVGILGKLGAKLPLCIRLGSLPGPLSTLIVAVRSVSIAARNLPFVKFPPTAEPGPFVDRYLTALPLSSDDVQDGTLIVPVCSPHANSKGPPSVF